MALPFLYAVAVGYGGHKRAGRKKRSDWVNLVVQAAMT
jgi:hypothetical protein